MKLVRYLANLGYGSRREVLAMFDDERIRHVEGDVLQSGDSVPHAEVLFDSAPLDPPPGLVLMLHKPTGYVCSTKDAGRLVYDLLPRRFRLRDPLVAPVGRLDRDTSGLLLFTDDGQLLHRIISPKRHLTKIYRVTLDSDLRGDEAEIFATGTLMLQSETRPLAPAGLQILSPREVLVSLIEGRYHQVRRMFAAVGNHVLSLHRCQIGSLELGALAAGEWRFLTDTEISKLSQHEAPVE